MYTRAGERRRRPETCEAAGADRRAEHVQQGQSKHRAADCLSCIQSHVLTHLFSLCECHYSSTAIVSASSSLSTSSLSLVGRHATSQSRAGCFRTTIMPRDSGAFCYRPAEIRAGQDGDSSNSSSTGSCPTNPRERRKRSSPLMPSLSMGLRS
jgi:hypothetical protein